MTRRLPLHNVDQSGATAGQVPIWDGVAHRWAPGASSSSVTTTLVPMVSALGAGDPDFVWTDDGELLMMEVPL
jgi:hypothetical protein